MCLHVLLGAASCHVVERIIRASTHWRQSRIRHGWLCCKSTMSLWPRTHWWQSRIQRGWLCWKATRSLWPRTHWWQSQIQRGWLCCKSTMSLCTHWWQSRKDILHSIDKSYPFLRKSTELNMFNFGNNVDGDKTATNRWESRLSTVCAGP